MGETNQNVNLALTVKLGGVIVSIPMADIISKFNLTGDPSEICLTVEKAGVTLQAMAIMGETEYPAIDVDAVDADGNHIYLLNAELPNQDYPESITSRLYAGYAAFESDSPIAMTRTQLRTPDEIRDMETQADSVQQFKKNIHVDYDLAAVLALDRVENLPEHA